MGDEAKVNQCPFKFTLCFSIFAANVVMYAKIIIRLGDRTVSDTPSDRSVTDVRKQIAVMLTVNGIVFFMSHIPVGRQSPL